MDMRWPPLAQIWLFLLTKTTHSKMAATFSSLGAFLALVGMASACESAGAGAAFPVSMSVERPTCTHIIWASCAGE